MTIRKFLMTTALPAFEILLPESARLVLFAEQHPPFGNGGMYAWFLMDPDAERRSRLFRIAPTGGPVFPGERHLASIVHSTQTVWHLFENVGVDDGNPN